ncbi:unnamed protein product, partial [Prorocentrum cordatum]
AEKKAKDSVKKGTAASKTKSKPPTVVKGQTAMVPLALIEDDHAGTKSNFISHVKAAAEYMEKVNNKHPEVIAAFINIAHYMAVSGRPSISLHAKAGAEPKVCKGWSALKIFFK